MIPRIHKDRIKQAVMESMYADGRLQDLNKEAKIQMIDFVEQVYNQCVKELEENFARVYQESNEAITQSEQRIQNQSQYIEEIESEREALRCAQEEMRRKVHFYREKLNAAEQRVEFWKQDAEFWSNACLKIQEEEGSHS